MKSQCLSAPLLLILLLPVIVAAVAAARKGPLLGGWKQIEDVKDPYVQEIGKFAVTEYNAQSKAELEFKSVLSGETQVVSGMNYRLVVEAKNGGLIRKYQATVFDKPWEKVRKLTSFKPLAD